MLPQCAKDRGGLGQDMLAIGQVGPAVTVGGGM